MDRPVNRVPLLIGAVLGASGVALGAFGAHWLRDAVREWGLSAEDQTRQLEIWETAVRYQMYHALALCVVGLLPKKEGRSTQWSTGLFAFGVLVFSGLLYLLVLTGVKVLGAIVPIGGVSLIAGWILLAIAVAKRP